MIKAIAPCVVLAFIVVIAFGDDDLPVADTNIPTRLSPDHLEIARSYRSLFDSAGEEGLAELHSHEDDSIAIQSAWESVTLTVPVEDGPTAYTPDASKVQWFLGFLEGRARVEVPVWWREAIIGCRANRREDIRSGDPQTVPYVDGCPIGSVVEVEGEAVIYRSGDDAMTIPEDFLVGMRDDLFGYGISGAFTEDRFFFTVHGMWGYPHRVGCIDRETGDLVWESEACGCWWAFVMGANTSYVTVLPTADDRVFVFGEASGFYMHVFSATDGQSLMQFSSNY